MSKEAPKPAPKQEEIKIHKGDDFTMYEKPKDFSLRNQDLFGSMSDRGKKFIQHVYDGLYKIPEAHRVLGRLDMNYRQRMVDRPQKEAVRLSGEIDKIEMKFKSMEASKQLLAESISDLQKQGLPGSAAKLQMKLANIERDQRELQIKKEKVQSQFEAMDNQTRLYTNKRDRVADKLIAIYKEKLKPAEQELKKLHIDRNQLDLQINVTESNHKKEAARLDKIEKQKSALEESYGPWASDKELREVTEVFTEQLREGREKIRREKEILAQKKAEMDEKIAKVDDTANLYKDKQEELKRIKEGRPLEIQVKEREKAGNIKAESKIKVHVRKEPTEKEESEAAKGKGKKEKKKSKEAEVKDAETKEMATFIKDWNTYLKKKYGPKEAQNEIINLEDFSYVTGLSEKGTLEFEDFKAILRSYMKVKHVSEKKFEETIFEFYLDKIQKSQT